MLLSPILKCCSQLARACVQTVNELPWELEEEINQAIVLLGKLSISLKAGQYDYMLPPNEKSKGEPVPAFEFLYKHMSKIKCKKFSIISPKDEELKTINLCLTSEYRTLRSGGMDLSAEIKAALTSLGEFAGLISRTMRERLILSVPHAEALRLRQMRGCLDLRKMASDTSYLQNEQCKRTLGQLYEWFTHRNQVLGPVQVIDDKMPDFEALFAQYNIMAARLHSAYASKSYQHWKGAKGVVIMKDMFTKVPTHTLLATQSA